MHDFMALHPPRGPFTSTHLVISNVVIFIVMPWTWRYAYGRPADSICMAFPKFVMLPRILGASPSTLKSMARRNT